MGIICCGGRHFDCYPFLKYVIDSIIEKYGAETEKVTVISGHCRGADQLGERYAKESGTLLKVFPAEWTKYGKAAGRTYIFMKIDNKHLIYRFLY